MFLLNGKCAILHKKGSVYVTVGEKIRSSRIDAGLTQKELGDKMGVDSATVGKYERGILNPKKETIQKFATALGVDYYTLDSKSFVTDKLSPTLALYKKMIAFIEHQIASGTTITLQSAQEERDKLIPELIKVNREISEAELRNAVPLYSEEDLQRLIEKINWKSDEAARAEEEKRLLEKFRRLNKAGKKVAVERVEELTQIPKYQCKDAAVELKMG